MNPAVPVPLHPLLAARLTAPTASAPGPTAPDAGPRLTLGRYYPYAPALVWRVLVEPDLVREWAPFTVGTRLDVVGPADLVMPGDGKEPDTPLGGQITQATPPGPDGEPGELEYTWGDDALHWSVAASGEGTWLELTQTLSDPESAAGVAAGWHLCLGVAEHVAAGTLDGPIRGATAFAYGWLQLNEEYAGLLGVTKETPQT